MERAVGYAASGSGLVTLRRLAATASRALGSPRA